MKEIIYQIYDFFTFKQLPYLIKFKKMQAWHVDDLKKFQLTAIQKNLGIKSWEEFYKLKITTKKDLPDSPAENDFFQHETSGSTGEPRIIWVPKESWYRKDAIFTRSWDNIGRSKNGKVFRLMAGEPKYAFYDSLRNVYPHNYRAVDEKTVESFLNLEPEIIHGPGGAIRQLCELLISKGHEESLKKVHIEWCSESSSGHKERLKPFVAGFHEQYGLAELPTVGSPDGEGNVRVVMEQGIIEILDDNGQEVREGEEGFIVVTDINNTITPIIRYQCGDRGKIKRYKNQDGLEYFILYDIIGRGVDYYNGPEVKKAIGWSIVSPISHILGDVIEKWRIEIIPKDHACILYVKFIKNEDYGSLKPYEKWIKDNYGLSCSFKKLEDEKYDIYFKNKLVRVTL